jgi:hypothetical protein
MELRRIGMTITEHDAAASRLLLRAINLLEDRPFKDDPKFWEDFLRFTGEHWICTDEGWEPGSVKKEYVKMAEEEGIKLSDIILCEVNAPRKRKEASK